MRWAFVGFVVALLTIDSKSYKRRFDALYTRLKSRSGMTPEQDKMVFDGYESIGEIIDWVAAPENLALRVERMQRALASSPGFANFHKYISTKGAHLKGYEGLIVRRPNEHRWGSTPSMEFWEHIYDPSGFANATDNKRSQLVRQLEETWTEEVKVIQRVIRGDYELPSNIIPLFSTRAFG
ncbi:hypothetical protein [Delftia phage PhiW-14]|uniref:Uncharacterized protein n=1 Tax=Delftia phage PhiW-14 TaxID=665032 RepID=C9DFZ5_BPW14|nr:hypothetical protein DP-phiW-14_gp023 [Delftia phage PhiW-14]ACV50046.1 hypothetical protein [Delftia phage PhiW-14]